MEKDNPVGRIVYSKVGRDKDKYYIVISILNESFVYIADGRLRKVEKPKKKKVKHLIQTEIISEEIRELIMNGKIVTNSKIRNFLDAIDAIKEV